MTVIKLQSFGKFLKEKKSAIILRKKFLSTYKNISFRISERRVNSFYHRQSNR